MPPRKLAIVACGVLENNIDRVLAALPDRTILKRILPAQLHQNPHRLRTLLQQEIDELSRDPDLAGIVIGFGVCGRGTVGLQARQVPLALPRTQDCIGIFLGSHRRYLEQFNQHPGTRYLTRGWYEKTIKDASSEAASYLTDRDRSLYGTSIEELTARYGADNARFISEFRESWKRNYRRAAYIRFPAEQGTPPGQALTADLARELGWEHEVVTGDDSLLFALLSEAWADPRILLVPPHNRTVSAPGEAVLGFTTGFDDQAVGAVQKYLRQEPAPVPQRSGIGLGIDTGGTFTDAVLFDFDANSVVAFAKADTTHGNLVRGIKAALRQLPPERIKAVQRVGLSTTLATNAFIERKGRPVGLLVMSPVPVHLQLLPFRYVRKIEGAMTINGEESEPLNLERVRICAREARDAGCEALAISGFGSVVNPQHELAAAEVALEASGLHAVCGHELTSQLNFIERATTAAMNAKLIPLIEELLDATRNALSEFGLGAVRLMVVKGDGSQMRDTVASAFPVETVLSGPAASVVGAARLFDHPDAVIVDMGGTTLDVARLHRGCPVLSDTGARIGEFKTSVRAMAIHTIGLGGDSEIDLSGWPEVRIGPRRVIPVCRLHDEHPGLAGQFQAMWREFISLEANCTDIVALTPGTRPDTRLLKELAAGPLLLGTLARRLNRAAPAHVPWRETEGQGRIVRYALTLTDILHHEGRYTAFDRGAVETLLHTWSMILDVDTSAIVERVHHEFRRLVCSTVLEAALPGDCPWDTDESLTRWLTAHLADARHERQKEGVTRFSVELPCPLIPVGAPAPTLFPELGPTFKQPIRISEFASVANAVGAIAGDVLLRETAAIKVNADGAFICSWRGGNERVPEMTAALAACEQGITELVRRDAAANEIPFSTPVFSATRHEAQTRDGPVFLGITLTGEIRG